jgi:RNA recognition motif-containing protein
MVQHTLVVKNIANTEIKADLAKELGDANKIVNISFKNKKPNKKDKKYALLTVKSAEKDAKQLVSLLDKKTVGGKELKVTVAKAPHERSHYLARVARLKKIEQYSSVWPARTYKNVSGKDPLTNYEFRIPPKTGLPLRIKPRPTIAKKKIVPSKALYLSVVPKTVSRKQVVEALKEHGAVKGTFGHKGKKTSYGFVFFKTPEARAKAQAALKAQKGLKIGEHTIQAKYANKYGIRTVHVPRKAPKAAPKDVAPKAAAAK